jgi:hypothetical protein
VVGFECDAAVTDAAAWRRYISGAMVFQSSMPVAIGLGFTDWSLSAR